MSTALEFGLLGDTGLEKWGKEIPPIILWGYPAIMHLLHHDATAKPPFYGPTYPFYFWRFATGEAARIREAPATKFLSKFWTGGLIAGV
jgi:hypothetical protein